MSMHYFFKIGQPTKNVTFLYIHNFIKAFSIKCNNDVFSAQGEEADRKESF
ncbi:hypothetical protein SAMN05216562_1651 [Microbulbifer marinus]|uniref:Uncharacterized protein n=1 Tax=Microbulbifer marinus TaxID=658218 RepID=A0A1H3YCG6_9GAMM|nr:hypothetical protein SAMN05216562_1651 [Microbulbifer marinus]